MKPASIVNNKQPNKPPSSTGNNLKNKNKIQPEEVVVQQPIIKEKNLERYIYITTYDDNEAMKLLKSTFEKVNRNAFNLKSVKEIYTKLLSPQEQDDNYIDYISGFQLIDKQLRITIIEGISKGAINYVKEQLPKDQMNDALHKVFSDKRILFDTRIYSKFNLSLKFIKLRDTLNDILTSFDIYTKSMKYREIYEAFMNIWSIMQSKTLSEISHAQLFPPAESMLLLERKYADILTEEDMTGLHTEQKTKKRKEKISDDGFTRISSSATNKPSAISKSKISDLESKVNQIQSIEKRKRQSLKARLDCLNKEFDSNIKVRLSSLNTKDFHKQNLQRIVQIARKPMQHFCKFNYDTNEDNQIKKFEGILTGDIYFHSSQKNNYYHRYLNEIREKIKSDNNNYYTYSKEYLTLSFPRIDPDKNVEYEKYKKNKELWRNSEDFNRYKQPKRDFVSFPLIKRDL